MTTAHDVVEQAHERSGRLSPADVQSVLFTRAGLGRRGYDEGEVDFFLERVQTELSRLLGEKVSLRDEVTELRARTADGGVLRDEASVQAVKVLSAAQLTADQYVADAESYTKRISGDARERSERMLDEALERAKQIVQDAEAAAEAVRAEAAAEAEGMLETMQAAREEAAAAEAAAQDERSRDERAQDDPALDAAAAPDRATADGAGQPGDPDKGELEQQVAYLRAFSQVCRVQLRAYLEALLNDVEVEWGRAHPGVVPAGARPSLRESVAGAAAPAGPPGLPEQGADGPPPLEGSVPVDGAPPVDVDREDDRPRADEALLRH